MSYTSIEKHQGTVSGESLVNEGTTITVLLPVTENPPKKDSLPK